MIENLKVDHNNTGNTGRGSNKNVPRGTFPKN
jgi:hypothetical protein